MSAKFDEYAASYEQVHETFFKASGEDSSYFHDYKVACLRRHGVSSSDALLDYGCGVGNLTERFIQLAGSVAGFDPSPKSIAVCRERAPGATLYSQAPEIPPASFDVVVLSGVLHHVQRQDRTAVMAGVLASTKPGGRVFIFEHNPWNPYTRRVLRDCPFDDDADPLTARGVKVCLRGAGFVQIVSEYIVFFPRFLARMRPLEARLTWCPLGAQTLTIGVRPL